MSMLQIAGASLTGVASVISKKRKKRRKRRKAKQRKQQEKAKLRNQLNAGFQTGNQSTESALDSVPVSQRDNSANATIDNNTVMYLIVGFLAYKFLMKK